MRSLALCGSACVLLALTSTGWATTVIDFEDWTGGGDVQIDVTSRGFWFGNGLLVSVASETGNSTYALHGVQHACKFAPRDEKFAIASLDLQEGLGTTSTRSIILVGYRDSLPAITQTFTLDGRVDTFETFYPVGFSDLLGATLSAYDDAGHSSQAFSLDNIVVPEPGIGGLVLLVFGSLIRRGGRV